MEVKQDARPRNPPGDESKFRQDSRIERPSERVRQNGGATSGQVGPKSGERKKAAKEARRMDKSKLRVEKAGVKLTVANEKLAAQKPPKRRGPVKGLLYAAGREVSAKVHGKIHEAEHDNVGLEAAHRAERAGESAIRATSRFVKRRNRTRPARRVHKWEQKTVRAGADLRYREMVRDNPGLKSNPVNRFIQKRRLRKQYQKQAKEAAKRTGGAAVSAVQRTGRAAAAFVRRHPSGVLVGLLCLFLMFILHSCMGAALTIGGGIGGAAGGTSYLAEDADINEAELRYTEWETDLEVEALDAPVSHPDFDEYRYDIAETGHDPYALLAYLTARYDDFTFAAVRGELQSIFDEQYSLTFTEIVEVRYRTETISYTDPYTGMSEDYEVEVPYNYYILETALTAKPFEDVISPRLAAQDGQDRYEVYMLSHGNRQYIGTPFPFNWHPYVSSYYGYRVHPIRGEKHYHTGADIALPIGTEILAGGDGVVLEAGEGGSYGLTLLVDYGGGGGSTGRITARYAHCDELLVGAGQAVSMGDVIALVGNTGDSTGPHLHLEVLKDGSFLNPLFFADGTIG